MGCEENNRLIGTAVFWSFAKSLMLLNTKAQEQKQENNFCPYLVLVLISAKVGTDVHVWSIIAGIERARLRNMVGDVFGLQPI